MALAPIRQPQLLYIGEAYQPNKITDNAIFMIWDAALVPTRECEGGGWYTENKQVLNWSFAYRAYHKSPGGVYLDTRSTWNTQALDVLLKKAATDIYMRYCKRN